MAQPIFKTHASLGKSILTSDLPDPKRSKDMSDSIFDIAVDHGLKEVWVIEENCSSLFELSKHSLKLGIELRFGLQVRVGKNVKVTNYGGKEVEKEQFYKQVLFAKNAEGVKQLYQLYTRIEAELGGMLSEEELCSMDYKNLHLVVPFYDSYLDKNLREFGSYFPQYPVEPIYFVEDHGLPTDKLLRQRVKNVAKYTKETRMVYYRRRKDFPAWQVYKLACDDKVGGKRPTFDSPNLEGCGSDDFCYEE